MRPDPEALEELVRRITSVLRPSRIILFGSAARGEMHEDSDLDVLVVTREECDRSTVRRIRRALFDFRYPKDIIVVTEADVELLGGNPNLIIHTALTEGKELYHAIA